VGEPPLLADPRRWGGVIGLVGGLVFVASYSPALGPVMAALAWAVALVLAVTALIGHYAHPVALGPLARPRPAALAVYSGCVVAEVALIAAGSTALTAAGRGELRPALIALVVGFHFLPFAWAFGERMFRGLGAALAAIGAAGLGLGALGVLRAAEASAVVAGLVLLAFSASYARGRFAPPR
jgi:hypothetical protein